MPLVPPRAGIADIAAYVPGASSLPGQDRVIKLASNEAALGPSPRAIEAARAAASQIHLYPDPPAGIVKQALAETHGLEAERLIVTPGSEYLLDLAMRCYAGPGDEVLFPQLSFAMYRILALAAGAIPVEAPAPNFTASVDALLDKVSPCTRIVAIANPNNPTGTWIPQAEIRRLREGLPGDVLLIIDSAYAEYPEDPSYGSGADIVRAYPRNTLMTRTFSKLYALANLRVGWGYGGEELLDMLARVRLPFCVTSPAAAAACAALEDSAHAAAELAHCRAWRPRLDAHVRARGLEPVGDGGNFLFVPVPAAMGGYKALDAHLHRAGIIARPIPPAGALRITVGTAGDNEALMAALDRFDGSARDYAPAL